MKTLKLTLLALAFSSFIGCTQVNRFLGIEEKKKPNFTTVQSFSGSGTAPTVSFLDHPGNAPVSIQAFICNQVLNPDAFAPCAYGGQPNDAQYQVPVYPQIQSSVTTPYAIWNYTAPDLQVVFENIPATVSYPDTTTADPNDVVVYPAPHVLFYIRSIPAGV